MVYGVVECDVPQVFDLLLKTNSAALMRTALLNYLETALVTSRLLDITDYRQDLATMW